MKAELHFEIRYPILCHPSFGKMRSPRPHNLFHVTWLLSAKLQLEYRPSVLIHTVCPWNLWPSIGLGDSEGPLLISRGAAEVSALISSCGSEVPSRVLESEMLLLLSFESQPCH